METAIIVAIISSVLSLAATVLNAVSTVLKQRKQDRLAIVTKGRIKYQDSFRAANADFLGRTLPQAILYSQHPLMKNEIKQNFVGELSVAAETLKTYLKPLYPLERTLHVEIDAIVALASALFLGETTDTSLLLEKRKRYYYLFSQYDWAYWKYIQEQSTGGHFDSDTDFDDIYEEAKEYYSSKGDYKWVE